MNTVVLCGRTIVATERESAPALRRAFAIFLGIALLGGSSVYSVPMAEAATGSIAGIAFQDMNRDGLPEGDEEPFEGHRLYLYDAADQYVGNATTDEHGRYVFGGLPDGSYRVVYVASTWWEMREDWVPTTTNSLLPRQEVIVDGGSGVADFGWRPIVRSSDLDEPIDEYVGANGLTVQTYNDVVPAREIFEAVMAGLVGEEAPHVTVRFGYGTTSATSTTVGTTDGVYTRYRAVSYVRYTQWLDTGDRGLAHEYGHAWSLYYAYLIQQDPDLTAYLEARGLADDDRVGTSYMWSPRELIAEDYRQLFGSENARSGGHLNSEVPPAWEVNGLEEFLRDVFTQPPGGTFDPEAASEPDPEPEEDPVTEADPEPLVTDVAMSPEPVRNRGEARFTLASEATVTVRILDAEGTSVRALVVDEPLPAGSAELRWDRRNDAGKRVSSGKYTLLVTAAGEAHTDADSADFIAH